MMNLIIVNGLPATGKTTIANKLSEKMDLILISKDTIKEFLFDLMGTKDREWSKNLGKLSYNFLYEITDMMLFDGQSFILENAFEKEFCKPKLESIFEKFKIDHIVEIYCFTDQKTRRQRYIDRNESGERHKGHVDNCNYLTDSDTEPIEKYASLEIGTQIYIDTSDTKNIKIDKIIDNINSIFNS